MIGFTTRREPSGGGLFKTHHWVVQELLMAHAEKLPWVEVREDGVVSPGGILEAAGTQRIAYSEAGRAACLVKIAQALNSFRERTSVTMVRRSRKISTISLRTSRPSRASEARADIELASVGRVSIEV